MDKESSNTIYIRRLRVPCIIGVRPEERTRRQDIFISAELHCRPLKGRETDDLEDTVDYSALQKEIAAAAGASRYFLIEALAEEIGTICIAPKYVDKAVVRVDKPGAIPDAETVGIEITVNKEAAET